MYNIPWFEENIHVKAELHTCLPLMNRCQLLVLLNSGMLQWLGFPNIQILLPSVWVFQSTASMPSDYLASILTSYATIVIILRRKLTRMQANYSASSWLTVISGTVDCNWFDKCSAVAEMGDHLTTIDMGQKLGAVSFFGRGELNPQSNTMWPGPRPTFTPSGILIHPAA